MAQSLNLIGNTLKKIATVSVPTIIIITVLLEFAFRFVIPAAQVPRYRWIEDYSIMSHDPLSRREGVYTIGPTASRLGGWRINDAGWNSAIEYQPKEERDRPLIAIIGDSYVEALSVELEENIGAAISNMQSSHDVYSFGISGAQLSQYYQMSRYVLDTFSPDVVVFVMIHNDFIPTNIELGVTKNYWQVRCDDVGECKDVEPMPNSSSLLRRLLGTSAFVRYLWFNLGLPYVLHDLKTPKPAPPQTESHTSGKTSQDTLKQIATETAVVHTIKQIVSTFEDRPVIFLMDAPRRDMYAGSDRTHGVGWMNDLLADICAKHGGTVLDLTAIAEHEYHVNGVRFDTDLDYHWGAVGHRIGAEVVVQHLRSSGILSH